MRFFALKVCSVFAILWLSYTPFVQSAPFLESELSLDLTPGSYFGGFPLPGDSSVSLFNSLQGEEVLPGSTLNTLSFRREYGEGEVFPGNDQDPFKTTVRSSIFPGPSAKEDLRGVSLAMPTFFLVLSPGSTSLSFDYEGFLKGNNDKFFSIYDVFTAQYTAFVDVFLEEPNDESTPINSTRTIVSATRASEGFSYFTEQGTVSISLGTNIEPNRPIFAKLTMESVVSVAGKKPQVTPIPEPSTALLFFVGLIVGAICFRRSAQQRSM